MTPARATATPDTLQTCYTGTNNTYEYYGWCDGTGPTSYRTIADCNSSVTGLIAYGVERWDGDNRQSYADCHYDNEDFPSPKIGGTFCAPTTTAAEHIRDT